MTQQYFHIRQIYVSEKLHEVGGVAPLGNFLQKFPSVAYINKLTDIVIIEASAVWNIQTHNNSYIH
jgi:hypothetical protein